MSSDTKFSIVAETNRALAKEEFLTDLGAKGKDQRHRVVSLASYAVLGAPSTTPGGFSC